MSLVYIFVKHYKLDGKRILKKSCFDIIDKKS